MEAYWPGSELRYQKPYVESNQLILNGLTSRPFYLTFPTSQSTWVAV
ncbi:MAG: hypothetical protein U5K79_13130 [Cyclobacteriaceae bacterium]|nr:hypothetical protein [Cyclobacteriaceae bacterium]